MTMFRIALANLLPPASPDESIHVAEQAIANAARHRADIICFPECFVPGYRRADRAMPAPDAAFLERAWLRVAAATATAGVTVILGTERVTPGGLVISTLVFDRDGTRAGFQDKTQIDPAEEELNYVAAASERRLFRVTELTFGISICHEGFRYPETVRWPARRGAHIVFHPHYTWAEPGSYRPATFADPANTFHEKAALCRAAENNCFFASVNYASDGSPTTSAIVRPDGTLLAYQPYGQPGLLVADIDISESTRLLAKRCKTYEEGNSVV
jgi:predicted amidohydrolase